MSTSDSYVRLRIILSALPGVVGPMMEKANFPEPGTKGFEERLTGGEIAKASHVQAGLAITVASDHMFALERALTEPVMTFAPFTIARVILEATATALWLLENIDLKARIARSLTLRLKHLQDERIYAINSHTANPHIQAFREAIPNFEAREHYLISVASSFGIDECRSRNGRLLGFDHPLPNFVDLTESQLGEGNIYRLLSAAAHNRTWANLALGLRHAMRAGEPFVEQYLDPKAALFLIASSVDWFARSAWAYIQLNGGDLKRLASAYEDIYDQGHLVEETRFWRGDLTP